MIVGDSIVIVHTCSTYDGSNIKANIMKKKSGKSKREAKATRKSSQKIEDEALDEEEVGCIYK